MKLLLLCSARYLLDTVYILLLDTLFVRCSRSWFDERIEHSKRNSLSEHYVLFSIYWIRTKWPTFSYSLEAKSLKSYHIHRISMRDVARSLSDLFFIRPYNHRLLTTEKVVDECKAIKLVNKCSRKKCQKLELLDCEKGCCVVVEL